MSLLFESKLFWIIAGIITFGIGYGFFANSRSNKTLLITLISTAVVLIGGLTLEHFVVTDAETIRATFRQVSTAICDDDLDRVKTFIVPNADHIRGVAVSGMSQARLDVVNFSNFGIQINDATVPTTAQVSFTVTFHGRLKEGTFLSGQPFGERYHFTVTLEKSEKKWLVTDDIIFDNRFPLSYGNTQPVLR
ncbi:MAG: nuclear transport factor 2 family protein [Planctomycetaceae bacterium]|nr:nuclear transport factor 2 family protein [Planctomycetaceae bacterium]